MNFSAYQAGGYEKGFRLKKTRNDGRFERSFTEVLEDGRVRGHYVGYDYTKEAPSGVYRMQGTAWKSAVKKAHRKRCTEYRDKKKLGMIMEDFNVDTEGDAKKIWKGLNGEERTQYTEAASKIQCPPMVILLRETTPGNNKANFTYRERKYYVKSVPINPVNVKPSRGPTPRIYRFETEIYPMHRKETLEKFLQRKGEQI